MWGKYTVTINGKKRKLSFKFQPSFKPLGVYLDHTKVGEFSPFQLLAGIQPIMLPDQSILEIKVERSFLNQEFRVLRNGQPVDGSQGHPLQKIKVAYLLMAILGGLNLISGLGISISNIQFLKDFGLDQTNIFVGLVYLFSFFIGRKKNSFLPLATGFVAFLLDTFFVWRLVTVESIVAGFIFSRVFFSITWITGLWASWELSKQKPQNWQP